MNPKPEAFAGALQHLMVVLCVIMIAPGDTIAELPSALQQQAAPATSSAPAAKIPADQLDALVAPIALFPDPMLAQTLAAATYPLEIIQLQQWLAKNKGLKDKALADAVAKQPWDPSIQALAGLPDLVKRLADDIQWTTDLGNAFLAQQADVMDAVQRMRKKAQGTGNLKSSEQQKVETKVIENKSTIIIEQANPQWCTFRLTIRRWCMGRRYTPILLFTIRLRDTTRRGWRSLSALVSRWARCGAAVGAGAAAGAEAITTSTSITTIISIAIRILMGVIALMAETDHPSCPHARAEPAELVVWAEQAESVALAEQAESVALAEQAVSVVRAVRVVWAELVVSVEPVV
jgi:hypothetical protein